MDCGENNLDSIFKQDGRLSLYLEKYEYRPHQARMAEEVKESLSQGKHLIIEAGTGIGKSLAYLAPIIQWACEEDKKAVISTYTINLQEQLISKDLPLLEKILQVPFKAVLAKGRNNYICLRKFQRVLEDYETALIPKENAEDIASVKEWAGNTTDGSLADMDNLPNPSLWDEICAEAGNCMGKKCIFFSNCFFQKARIALSKAQIAIVNHHLFFSDLSLKRTGRGILPDYDVMVFDEAHFIEDVATQHLGFEISNTGVRYLLNRIYNPRYNKGLAVYLKEPGLMSLTSRLHKINSVFFNKLEVMTMETGKENILKLKKPAMIENTLLENLTLLSKELNKVKKRLKNADLKLELSSCIIRNNELIDKLNIFIDQLLLGHIYWIELEEKKRQKVALKTFPITISSYLKPMLFDNEKPVILTGATLTVNNSFQYIKMRLGADSIKEIQIGTGFNYKEQMRIYIPRNLPSPKESEAYKKALAEIINKYLDITCGKAFVLFTNNKLMQETYDNIEPVLKSKGIRSFIQGRELSKNTMLEKFKKDINSVLFGTDSFWTGVDVEGESLSNVIITKLPFAVPDHPLIRARIEYIEQNKGNAFRDYSLPQAVIKLRQGVGRLIRSRSDKGIIVILDSRILTHNYGRDFLNSLPECPVIVQ